MFSRRTPEEEAAANLARAANGFLAELTREPTRADAIRDRMGPRMNAVGAAITAGWAQFTTAIAARFQRSTPPPQPARPALNYAAIAAEDAAGRASWRVKNIISTGTILHN